MWEAIKYVSSGVTLLAFLAAAATWIYRTWLLREARLLKGADTKQKVDLAGKMLEFFAVDTSTMSEDSKLEVALRQIEERTNRHRLNLVGIIVVAIVFAIVTVVVVFFEEGKQGHKDGQRPEFAITSLSPGMYIGARQVSIKGTGLPPDTNPRFRVYPLSQESGREIEQNPRSLVRDQEGNWIFELAFAEPGPYEVQVSLEKDGQVYHISPAIQVYVGYWAVKPKDIQDSNNSKEAPKPLGEGAVDLSRWCTIHTSGPEGLVPLAIITAMETALAKRGHPVQLSARYLGEKARGLDTASNAAVGYDPASLFFVAERWGTCLESSWPTVPRQRSIPQGTRIMTLDAEAARHRARVYRLDSLADVARQLQMGRPLVIGVGVDSSFLDYKTGIFDTERKKGFRGFHLVTLVGYYPQDKVFRLANYWGKNWGEIGFMRIKGASNN